VEIIKIGDSDPEPFTPAARPLSGLRVLSATHVIVGNVMSRTLAEHGPDVLQISHPEEFEHEALILDPCSPRPCAFLKRRDTAKTPSSPCAERARRNGRPPESSATKG
jgi:hypothetical protein